MVNNQLLELIQLSLGVRNSLSPLSPEEWQKLYKTARLHAVAGVCWAGIQRLPQEQKPPRDLYLQWLGIAAKTQRKNELMDKRSAIVWQKLRESGLVAAILKGQGMAWEYGHTESKDNGIDLGTLRQSGDIDVWVLGGYDKVCGFVQRVAPTTDVAYHRFHLKVFSDTEVELHHRPTLMRNLFDDRKLEKWYNSFGADSFIYLKEKGFSVPPPEFNRIFILTHIYRHFLFEGIGLRQVMDYYFVLKGHSERTEDTAMLLKHFRLKRFAEAIMWILHTQFGLQEKYLICGMNEKEGKFVMNEILTMGNFGRADQRYRYKHLRKIRHRIAHGSHLLIHYPSEVLWTPIWLGYHHYWKKARKREILKM